MTPARCECGRVGRWCRWTVVDGLVAPAGVGPRIPLMIVWCGAEACTPVGRPVTDYDDPEPVSSGA